MMDNHERRADPAHTIPQLLMDTLPLTIRVMSAQMRESPHGLSIGHLPILAALDEQPFTQHQLATMMSVSSPTMSNTLTTLEARGWIIRQRSQEDRRLVHTHLTDAGRTVLHASKREMEAQLEQMLTDLSAEEREQLVNGLQVLQNIFYKALGVIEALEHDWDEQRDKHGK
jgi:DNA-binding MarR family transcriptional regulator